MQQQRYLVDLNINVYTQSTKGKSMDEQQSFAFSNVLKVGQKFSYHKGTNTHPR